MIVVGLARIACHISASSGRRQVSTGTNACYPLTKPADLPDYPTAQNPMALLTRRFLRQRSRPRLLIAGGNFAGLMAARGLDPERFNVTVLDPEPAIEWRPNIHELISRRKTPAQLQHDRGLVIERLGHEFLQDAVVSIDTDQHRLQTRSGIELEYDALIVAVGGIASDLGVPGVRQHAMTTKSVAECHRLSNTLTRLAALPGNRTVTIVGGGIEGLEVLGEILRRFGGGDRFDLHLVEARSQLFEQYTGLHEHLLQRMGDDVTVHCGQRVSTVQANVVTLENGEHIESRLTLWTAGNHGHPVLTQAGLSPPHGDAPVTASLQNPQHPDIFVIGDAARLPSPIEKQAYHAQDMGRHVARHMPTFFAKHPLPPFQPRPKPTIISFGDRDALMLYKGRALATPALSGLKEAVYQYGYHELMPPRSRSELSSLARDLYHGINMLDTWRMLAGSAEARLFQAR